MTVQRLLRGPLIWLAALGVLLFVLISTITGEPDPEELSYGEFIARVDNC